MDNREILRGQEKKINWYPGHMARAKRELQAQLSRVDLAIELCDARIPRASRNPDFAAMNCKKRLLVLGKSDLAEEAETRVWLSACRANGEECMAFDSVRGRAKDVISRIESLTRPEVERMAERGAKKIVRVLVVGIPNVGKSTFVNRIKGTAIAKTGDRPGVTRSNQWVKITPWLELLDTPGLLWPNLQNQEDARMLCYTGTISDQVVDTQMLSIRLLELLLERFPDRVTDRFHLKQRVTGEALLEEACRGRGWILPGGVPDTERGAAVILDEYRAGKLGRITLQRTSAERKR